MKEQAQLERLKCLRGRTRVARGYFPACQNTVAVKDDHPASDATRKELTMRRVLGFFIFFFTNLHIRVVMIISTKTLYTDSIARKL